MPNCKCLKQLVSAAGFAGRFCVVLRDVLLARGAFRTAASSIVPVSARHGNPAACGRWPSPARLVPERRGRFAPALVIRQVDPLPAEAPEALLPFGVHTRKLGLEALRSAVNPGLKALLEVAQVGGRPLTSGEVGFRMRINAAGRVDVARDVIELFSVKDAARAHEIANKLDQLNSDRQAEERRILMPFIRDSSGSLRCSILYALSSMAMDGIAE